MKEKILQTGYVFYYLVSKPIKNIINFFEETSNDLSRPKNLLKFSITTTILIVFYKNVIDIINWLKPTFNYLSWSFLAITIVVYIWKYTDKKYGEGWKPSYYKWRNKK